MTTNISASRFRAAPFVTSPAVRLAERGFYSVMAVALAAAVFLGFARTFFLRAWFPDWAAANGAPEAIFYWHGSFFAAWYLLLVAQTSLVAARQVRWHRRAGLAGAGLAAGMVVLGVIGSLVAARRPTGFINVPVPPLQFLIVPLASIALFGAFVAAAVVRRRDPPAHKRYMLLASIVMLEAAVGRWPFAFMKAPSPVPWLKYGGARHRPVPAADGRVGPEHAPASACGDVVGRPGDPRLARTATAAGLDRGLAHARGVDGWAPRAAAVRPSGRDARELHVRRLAFVYVKPTT